MIKTTSCDVLVVGAGGAMGAATTDQLASVAKGKKIIAVEQFKIPHNFGSSHGGSRIARQAIGDGDIYTGLAIESYQRWRQLERDTGLDLLNVTGGLLMSSAGSVMHGRNDFVDETARIAVEHGIKHEQWTAHDVRTKYGQFRLKGDEKVYFEYEAGLLRPENCILAQLQRAKTNGADIRTGERVLGIKPIGNDRVTVFTSRRIYEAGKVVLTAGPWASHFLKEYKNIFKVYRQVMYWFHPSESIVPYQVGNFPIFFWGFPEGILYGFPAIDGQDGGVKVATEQFVRPTDPDMVEREVTDEEKMGMHRDLIANRLPGLSSQCVKAESCLYTVTPDFNFVICPHPEFPQLIIVAACSGHAFKHSAAIGRIARELALDGKSSSDISQFNINRFIA